MTPVDPFTSLADVVNTAPVRARLLEALRLDYGCRGDRTLAEACMQRGLHAPTVAVVLAALDESGWSACYEAHDVAGSSIAQLCDHIVAAHHGPLRSSLARVAHLLTTVVRVHRSEHPELEDLHRLFFGLRAELEEHMMLEERIVFPACRALERGYADGFDAPALIALEDDHAKVGDALVALRELTGGYRAERAYCGTHRAMLDALRGFASDLHQHIHEENNVLFPQVRALSG